MQQPDPQTHPISGLTFKPLVSQELVLEPLNALRSWFEGFKTPRTQPLAGSVCEPQLLV